MLKFNSQQLLAFERASTGSRVLRFIASRCRRDDFKRWAQDRPRLEALWPPLWPQCRAHSEHDLALSMVMLAVAAHEGVDVGSAAQVLQYVAENEVPLKSALADRGYFHFTAFDSDEEQDS